MTVCFICGRKPAIANHRVCADHHEPDSCPRCNRALARYEHVPEHRHTRRRTLSGRVLA